MDIVKFTSDVTTEIHYVTLKPEESDRHAGEIYIILKGFRLLDMHLNGIRSIANKDIYDKHVWVVYKDKVEFFEDILTSNGDSIERIIHSKMTRYLPNPQHCETKSNIVWRRGGLKTSHI